MTFWKKLPKMEARLAFFSSFFSSSFFSSLGASVAAGGKCQRLFLRINSHHEHTFGGLSGDNGRDDSGLRDGLSGGLSSDHGLGGRLGDSGGGSGLLTLGLVVLLLLLLLLLLSGLVLLAEQGAENAGALTRLRAALGSVLLLLLLLFLLVLGSSLLLGLGGLLDSNGSQARLGQLLELSLVALAGGDVLLLGLGLGSLGLEGSNPAVTLGATGGLEGVLLAVDLEQELVDAILADVGDIGLKNSVRSQSNALRPIPILPG